MTMTIEDAIDNEIVVILHFLKALSEKYYEILVITAYVYVLKHSEGH